MEFKGDSVEKFFFVFIELGEDGVTVLLGIFKGSYVAEGDVSA